MAKSKRNILALIAPYLEPIIRAKDLTIVAFILAIVAIIIVPLPSGVLDFFLTISLAISVLIILISLYIPKPTDLTTFPTLILIITLFRLALNIATTRMILSKGHEGPDAVSDIISSFGQFVVGGNYVIGIVVFTILVLINFMVITKGSTRVAEVAARFTLDAMPGKQMAIDADLNAGLIDEKTARERRENIIQEANFYGAMDGSSKFVKGDAVAGIIITIVNIIGGFLIGIFQNDLDVATSAQTYTLLTIGDGLVSQLPALISSTATGIIITRASKEETNFAEGAITQLLDEHKTLLIVGFILLIFALVPGLPTLSLGFVGITFLSIGYLMKQTKEGHMVLNLLKPLPKAEKEEKEERKPPKKSQEEIRKEEESALEDILKLEILELDLGYQLIKLADPNQGGDLLERIRSMRRKIAQDFGFLMPQVRIRDNLHLNPNHYQIQLKGIEIGEGEIYPDKFLAMDSGLVTDEIEGMPTKEPAFGLDALWIEPELKEDAIIKGYTAVDPATVISTHMSELVKKYAEELLTRQEVQNLVNKLKQDYPVVVEDCLQVANVGLIQKVLKALLHEHIPIKDLLTILETISDVAEVTKNVDIIVEQVRSKLARVITKLYKDEDGLKLLTFNTDSEQKLLDALKQRDNSRDLMLSIGQINSLVQTVTGEAQRILNQGVAPVVLIVDPLLRKSLVDIFEKFGLEVVVLSHAEIDPSVSFEVLGSIDLKEF
ncbi:MAG: flagellar biosynthesis protein FlhA [Sulfurospirillaceae bacterium]|nr:flagellar biosynthesis protein FlhA [Sulfurospirillaceae bacterium]MCK9546016.1 flagellar biosynthesis protein FlhA [Sulfurospirillaceae bacterium]MDY0237656.1 flagellar biosynthesis protein FlhA [Campylobacterales bacterium]NLM98856.1 flagellar biosynthesis protein FlhA [Campylobacteraceae bacterium]